MKDDPSSLGQTQSESERPVEQKAPRDRFATLGEKLVEQQRRRQTGSIAVSVAYATGEILHTAMDDVGPEQPSLSTLVGYGKMLANGAVATKDAAIAQGIRSAALHIEAKELARKKRDARESDRVADAPTEGGEPPAKSPAPARRDSGGMEI